MTKICSDTVIMLSSGETKVGKEKYFGAKRPIKF